MDFPRLVNFTPTLDTNIYANNDTLFDSQLVSSLFYDKDRPMILDHLVAFDKADLGVAMDLYFLSANVVFGTVNSGPSISDTDIVNICGLVSIATGDWKDLGGARVAVKSNLGLILKPVSASQDIYMAAQLGASTPTFAASDLVFRLGMRRF